MTSPRPVAIFDLDGTLCDMTHRVHMITGETKDWDGFYRACYKDAPRPEIIGLAKTLYASGYELWLFSGRSEAVEVLTETWLVKHGIAHMFNCKRFRPRGDYAKDDELKRKWFMEQTLDEDRERVVLVFDDRDRLVRMWRSLGVTCCQVADGDF